MNPLAPITLYGGGSRGSILTLHEAASEMHPEWQGGQILPVPIRTSLEAILTQIFHITWIGEQK